MAVATAVVVAAACGGKEGAVSSDLGTGTDGGTDAGNRDGGSGSDGGPGNDGGPVSDGGTDGGTDGGPATDGGTDGGNDGGPATDGGTDGGVTIVPPSLGNDWKFYTTSDGLPSGNVMGASIDEGGTLWVAAGTSGVFAMRNGTSSFQKFGITEGLHPYGYLNGDTAKSFGVPDGSPADKNPSLSATPAISIAGGPPNTAFVGYQGKQGCEDAWKWDCALARPCVQTDSNGKCIKYGACPQATPPSTWGDPSIYKSGDADKVSLTGSGISVTHFDIFSGPNIVADEQGGREKLCSIYRVVYQRGTNHLWLGGNHGFAYARLDQSFSPSCNGQIGCGVWEHVHPAFNDAQSHLVTDGYYGVAVDQLGTGQFRDVWFGGMTRTTRFKFGEQGGNYWGAQSLTEDAAYWRNRIDVWADPVGEVDGAGNRTYPTPQQWGGPTIDLVSGIAAMGDGTVWVSSFAHGLRHLTHDGFAIEDFTKLTNSNVSALAADTDGSLWVGYQYVGGFSRIKGNTVQHYDASVLKNLANSMVTDIQVATTPRHAVVISFKDGAVAVYTGQ